MKINKIYAAIIEDEEYAKNYLQSVLESNFPDIEIVAISDSVKEGVAILNTTKVDVVFMDIELTDGLSFEIFEKLNNYDFEVIFITGFDNYLTKAFEHYAFNYLLKPLDPEELVKVVNRFLSMKTRFSTTTFSNFNAYLNSGDPSVLIHVGDSHLNLSIKDILYCSAEGNYTCFHTIDKKKLLASNILKYYEGLLGAKGFFRASRSALVNVKHISSIYKKETIILANNEKVHVSTRNRTKLNELISKLS